MYIQEFQDHNKNEGKKSLLIFTDTMLNMITEIFQNKENTAKQAVRAMGLIHMSILK